MKTCPECGKTLNNQNNKFCNKSCAASYNNKTRPKKQPSGACRTCQNPIPRRKTWCSETCKEKTRINPRTSRKQPDLGPLPACKECGKEKSTRGSSLYCEPCRRKLSSKRVVESRRNKKKQLVESHGSQCVDCGLQGPSYIFDFDHREPENKSFGIAGNMNKFSFDDLYQETLKCDLVCALCHRYRTHLQRCSGCDDCRKEIIPVM